MQRVAAIDEEFDRSTQIAVALSSSALTIDPAEWSAFRQVDFIVATPADKQAIRANGTRNSSVDIVGKYSSDSLKEPYLAASIPFAYFVQIGATARNVKKDQDRGEYFINFIVGNGKCPQEKIGFCQNDALLRDTSYLYASTIYHFHHISFYIEITRIKRKKISILES